MDALLNEFLTETYERMGVVEGELAKLERNPRDPEPLGAIFRFLHTVKGTCSFFPLPRLKNVVHDGESALSELRDGGFRPTVASISSIHRCFEEVKTILAEIEARAPESGDDPEGLIKLAVNNCAPEARSAPPGMGSRMAGTGSWRREPVAPRIQPIGGIWSKLPDIVQDLSLELGKTIEIRLAGADVMIDRRTATMLIDPLMHMVRNAADHGIEKPATRARLGKPAKAVISLRSHREADEIVVELKDDGRGLAINEIKEKAQRLGLVPETALGCYSTQQIQNLVFQPGLSTAQRVTSVSGRGVGMDVVRTNIQAIGGSVTVTSETGRGTTFKIVFPAPPAHPLTFPSSQMVARGRCSQGRITPLTGSAAMATAGFALR